MNRPPLASRAGLVVFVLGFPPLAAQVPEVLVGQGVRSYSLVWPKVFWHTPANCFPGGGEFPPSGTENPEVLTRVASAGGMIRKLLDENPSRPPNICNPYRFHSDVAADATHVYWVDPTGLVRLSTDANVGDDPELLTAVITGDEESRRAELAVDSEVVYALVYDGADSRLYSVGKETGTPVLRETINGVRARRLSTDGKYVYWLQGGSLRRGFFSRGVSITTIATGVTGYYAEGEKSTLIIGGGTTEYVWIGKSRQLFRYNNVDSSTSAALYTSTDPTGVIYSLTSIAGSVLLLEGVRGVFFLEARTVTSPDPPMFELENQLLFRVGRSGGEGDLLYFRNGSFPGVRDAGELSTDGAFLFWEDEGRVLRHPADAEALPMTNMRVTDLEVTQAIQDLANAVRLIEGKRTFVRLHVRSDDPAASVAGVYAHLTATWTGGSGGPLAPINSVGSRLTVVPSPDRDNIDQSFLFEIPLSWTSESNLRLTGVLNPHKLPLQESYANNSRTVGPLTFEPSARLAVQFVAFEFSYDGTTYSPDYTNDILPTYSWIRRAYPLASNPGSGDDPTPGFRPRLFYIFDDDLGARVDQSASGCKDNLCASAYTNSKMAAWRVESGSSLFYYGFIKDAGSVGGVDLFPRGQAAPSDPVSSGPTGDPSLRSFSNWDTDSTYGDWYAGHEIGHTFNRDHPSQGNMCGHSASDPNYPYTGALIGPAGGSLAGFDAGDYLNDPAVLPRDTWSDLMGYCAFQWISDYTYDAMYDFMEAAGAGAAGGTVEPAGGGGGGAGIGGDWLSAFGVIDEEDGTAIFHHLRRLDEVAFIPPQRGREYALHQRAAGGAILMESFIDAEPVRDDVLNASLSFGAVVPFAAGAREVCVVRTADGHVLACRAVSSSPPEIDDVAIEGAPGPIAGIAELSWSASDADGDTLCFDILHSADGGASFQPLIFNHKAMSAPINTGRLGGGGAILRVIASDGVQCARADTPPFTITPKPPSPRILTPADGTRIQHGQLLTFTGEADDLQDGSVPGAMLQWSGFGLSRRFITGASVCLDDVAVGENLITLTARNSLGLSATASITVFVHDDLSVPGATLAVGPEKTGWHVPPGTSALQTRTLSISNSGRGTLNWTASEDAGWLELGAAGGTAPSQLLLSANPSGLPEGTALSTVVTIHGPAGQSVEVPVSLNIGAVFNEEDTFAGGMAFIRGDCDGDGEVRGIVTDAIFFLNYNFTGGDEPPCLAACDTNGDGEARGLVTDAIYLLSYNFLGGEPPPSPFPGCGPGEGSDTELGCAEPPPDC
jgi:hypothetical protein